MSEQKKFLDADGVRILWDKISMQDYPNNATLMGVINAIDSTKADKEEIPEVDATLSTPGAAADAKAVGQAIENIELTPGPKGDSGVYIGPSAPTDESVNVWIRDTDNSDNVLNFVSYTPQTVTPEQQAQARQNIGIDELPTSGGTNYRLIAKIVFDETNQPYRIQITQDMDGKPLELTKLFMYADWKAHATARADCSLFLNDDIDMQWVFNIEKTAYKYVYQVEAFDGFCRIETNTKIEGTSKAGGGAVYVRDMAGSKINKILWSSPLTTMSPPVGSVLAVYGY